MKMQYKEICFDYNGVLIANKYNVTYPCSLHIMMEMPYRINKVFYEVSYTQLKQEDLEFIVKKRVTELYDMIRVIEKNKDNLIKILDKYRVFQLQLTDIELRHKKEDIRISAEELNHAVDYLLEEYFRILIKGVFGNENNEICEIPFKIGPEFLQNIIKAVKAKRVHNF